MAPRFRFALALALSLAALALIASAAGAAPAWTTYRHDAGRSGVDPDSTNPLTPARTWQTPALDGEVYGQPLVHGSYVYVATENDSIYELNAATGAVQWANHLATPEPSSAAPCGDISPSIGITSTPVIDPTTNRIYAVGAVSVSGTIEHELFALDLSSGQPVPGFPMVVDPPYPSGGSAVNQLQRPGLALDAGRILIGYGGNNGDCATYWGWLVSAPANGSGGLGYFQVDSGYHAGAIWGSGNAPPVDASGNVFVATGNGIGNSSSNPEYGDSVVKLDASASPLDWWSPTNWHSLDASDADLGSSMPTLLPGGYVFQTGKDHDGYLLNGGGLGGVSSPVAQVTGFCPGGSFGGSVYNSGNSTVYVACNGGLQALSLGSGAPPSLTVKSGFAAPATATGPPMIAGGLVWVTNYSTGILYGLDPNTGAAASQFSIPENGSDVNHFAIPSAGGGQLFVGSGNQVTAYTVAQAPLNSAVIGPAGVPVLSQLRVAPRRVSVAGRKVGRRCVRPSKRNRNRRYCHRQGQFKVSFTLNQAAFIKLTVKRQALGRKIKRQCVKPTAKNRRQARCWRWVAMPGNTRLTAGAGASAFTIPGKIGGHVLGPGSYQLIATPTTGALTGRPQTMTLRVVVTEDGSGVPGTASDQSGYSSLRQALGSSGSLFGVRFSRNEW